MLTFLLFLFPLLICSQTLCGYKQVNADMQSYSTLYQPRNRSLMFWIQAEIYTGFCLNRFAAQTLLWEDISHVHLEYFWLVLVYAVNRYFHIFFFSLRAVITIIFPILGGRKKTADEGVKSQPCWLESSTNWLLHLRRAGSQELPCTCFCSCISQVDATQEYF